MATFPSAEWFTAYADAINSSPEHKAAAADWEGDVSYVIGAQPELGLHEDMCVWMDLWHGECRDVKVVSRAEADRAEYVILGSYSKWKKIVRGELDALKAMTTGSLQVRGDLPEIVRRVSAVSELVRLASQIPTEFPDEQ